MVSKGRTARQLLGRTLCIAVVSAAAFAPRPARAVQIQVDWSAAVSGSLGTGTVSGTLGVFDMDSFPSSSLLPATGLTANVAFTYSPHGPADFFSGAYPQISNAYDTALAILSPSTVELVGSNPNPHSSFLGFDSGIGGAKPVILLRADDTVEVRSTFYYSWGTETHAATGPVSYTLTIVPEPASLLLLGSGVAWVAAVRRRRRS